MGIHSIHWVKQHFHRLPKLDTTEILGSSCHAGALGMAGFQLEGAGGTDMALEGLVARGIAQKPGDL